MIILTVKLEESYLSMILVKISAFVLKDLVFETMNILSIIKIAKQVKVGNIIVTKYIKYSCGYGK